MLLSRNDFADFEELKYYCYIITNIWSMLVTVLDRLRYYRFSDTES